MRTPLRILFMGTPDFSTPILKALAQSQHDVVAVVTNPDRQAGRGKKVTPPPVKVTAEAFKIPVFQPPKLRNNDDLYEQLSQFAPDVAVVVAYGQILPQRFLDLPKYGSLNIHASLLPKYRGASPINAAIIHGETTSGVTIMKMERGLDTGPMLAKFTVEITPEMTAEGLHDTLSQLGSEHVVEIVEAWCNGEIEPTPQSDADATYAPMMSKEDGNIDWSVDATTISNLIRGVTPWPGAHTTLLREKSPQPLHVKILRAQPIDYTANNDTTDTPTLPGSLIVPDNDTIVVRCGRGYLQLLEVQPAGKRPMSPRDFINGFQPDQSFTFGSNPLT